jgi:dihydroorotate dehydrogenase electron transfer subunit
LSACRIESNELRTTPILRVERASPTVKTYRLNDALCSKAEPGQFLMLWIPGVDEIPLSIMNTDRSGDVSVAVQKVGEATKSLHKNTKGDLIGVRGPFGTSFSLKAERALMVGGGTGMAPLHFLIRKLNASVRITLVAGAKTKSELLFMDEIEQILGKRGKLIQTTEDNTCGIVGLCTDPLEELLTREKFDMVYCCGPEPMIRKVFDLAEEYKLHFEASLERLMRCAVGLCGSCVLGKYQVCRDGPVFDSRQLRDVKAEFGVSKRDFAGKTVGL